jgi:hypothetical protein
MGRIVGRGARRVGAAGSDFFIIIQSIETQPIIVQSAITVRICLPAIATRYVLMTLTN